MRKHNLVPCVFVLFLFILMSFNKEQNKQISKRLGGREVIISLKTSQGTYSSILLSFLPSSFHFPHLGRTNTSNTEAVVSFNVYLIMATTSYCSSHMFIGFSWRINKYACQTRIRSHSAKPHGFNSLFCVRVSVCTCVLLILNWEYRNKK